MTKTILMPAVIGSALRPSRAGPRNLIPSSEDLNSWARNGATVAGPLGLNALGLYDGYAIASNGSPWHRAQALSVTVAEGDALALRLILRSGSSGDLRLVAWYPGHNQGDSLMGSPGSLPAASAGFTVLSDTALADGISRQITASYTASQSGTLELGVGPNTATAGQDVIVLAMQIEHGTAPSAYQKTPI